MKKYFYLLLIPGVLLLTGCSQYGYVRLNYPVKPVAQFPNNASKIALINRSLPKTFYETSCAAESLTSGEIAGSDEKASFEALKGVYKTLDGKNGVSIRMPNLKLYEKGTREIPDPLDWNKVKSICDSTKTDLLLSLEVFDSNSDIISSNVQKIVRVLSGGFPSLPKAANVDIMHIWRLYDPSTKDVIEQYDGMRYFKMARINSEQLNAAAYDAGVEYIRRYLPVYLPVKRRFYKKGKGQENDSFQAVFRRTQIANWVNAIEEWKKIVKTGSMENAGRAAFNIAVAYEVLDKTNQALDWAKRSFEDFGQKPGREYYNILQKRAEIELK